MADYSRRNFSKMITKGLLSASSLLGLGGLFHYLDVSTGDQPKTELILGSASDFPIGSRTVFSDIPAMLIHNEGGFTAFDLICPHLGCTVTNKDDGFVCPCHGSQFNLEGDVQRGPAKQSLRLLRVELGDDNLLHLLVPMT